MTNVLIERLEEEYLRLIGTLAAVNDPNIYWKEFTDEDRAEVITRQWDLMELLEAKLINHFNSLSVVLKNKGALFYYQYQVDYISRYEACEGLKYAVRRLTDLDLYNLDDQTDEYISVNGNDLMSNCHSQALTIDLLSHKENRDKYVSVCVESSKSLRAKNADTDKQYELSELRRLKAKYPDD